VKRGDRVREEVEKRGGRRERERNREFCSVQRYWQPWIQLTMNSASSDGETARE
jgi:hypothetical protein